VSSVTDVPAQLRAQVADAALRVLEDEGLVVQPRSLLEMSRDELRTMAFGGLAQSYALLWLSERVASWASRPDESLVSILKAGQGSDPRVLADMARKLHAVGIHDLDDWLPPEEGEPADDA
jgi:nucleotide-binding universal stress UspA family protein